MFRQGSGIELCVFGKEEEEGGWRDSWGELTEAVLESGKGDRSRGDEMGF
jgi:hypothetical protein